MNTRNEFLIAVLICLFAGKTFSQDLVLPTGYPGYTISATEDVSPGYFFLTIQPTTEKESWIIIIDNYGTPIYYHYFNVVNTNLQLQPSGYLNFSKKITGASTTAIMDSNYSIIDEVPILNGYKNDRHDFVHSSNGDYILIGEDPMTMDLSGIVPGGLVNAIVEGGVVQVQSADKQVLLDWNTKDYFNILDTQANLTLSTIDNIHPNSIVEDLDGNILLISRSMNELTKINRSTGDIIWRMGGKNNQFTFSSPADTFSMPHCIKVLKNGNYTLFDNGNFRDPPYSRAIEYSVNTDNMTVERVWEYSHDSTVFSRVKGSTQRLEGGNTLIAYSAILSPGILEVTPDGRVVWQLDYPAGVPSPKAFKYPWHTTLFTANTDSVDFGNWDGSTQSVYTLRITNNGGENLELSNYHVHTSAFRFADGLFPMTLAPGEERSMDLIYFPDDIDSTVVNDVLTINSDINTANLVQRIALQVHLKGTKSLTSISDNSARHFSLHPNPAMETLTLELGENVMGPVCIYTMNGSLVFKTHILGSKTILDLKMLENGMYILEVFDEISNTPYRKKFVKQ